MASVFFCPFVNFISYKYISKDNEGQIMNKKVRTIAEVNEITLAFIIFGLAVIILGGTMLYGGMQFYGCEHSFGLGISNFAQNTISNGVMFLADGILLMILAVLTLKPHISVSVMKLICNVTALIFILSVISMIKEMICGSGAFEIVGSASGAIICGILFFIFNYSKKTLINMHERRKYRNKDNSNVILKMVG